MNESDIIRCDYCGDLMFRKHEACRACGKINRQTMKGISHAETNLWEESMVATTQRSERA